MKRFLSAPKTPSFPLFDSLDPTEQLLLLASRTALSESEAEKLRVAAADDEVDWENFYDLANFHRVFALVYRNLMLHAPEALPPTVADDFSERVSENNLWIIELTGELVRLSEAFDKKKIPFLPLKGPMLAASVYGDIALRPAGDLDLLVDLRDVPAALDILRAAGFSVVLREPGAFATPRQEAAVCRYLYHFILFDEERELVVELHFNLSPRKLPFQVTPDELFSRASTFPVAGREIPIPHPVDNLIYLCLHGGKHAWSRVEWLVGIAELLKQMGSIDETEVSQLARQRNALRPLLLGLLLAAELLDTNVTPQLVREAQGDHIVRKLAQDVASQLPVTEEDPQRQNRFQLALYPTLLARLRWVFYSSLQPGYADIRSINVEWLSLYYLIRPIRLAGKLFGKSEKVPEGS